VRNRPWGRYATRGGERLRGVEVEEGLAGDEEWRETENDVFVSQEKDLVGTWMGEKETQR
jgi:hypothetical protein